MDSPIPIAVFSTTGLQMALVALSILCLVILSTSSAEDSVSEHLIVPRHPNIALDTLVEDTEAGRHRVGDDGQSVEHALPGHWNRWEVRPSPGKGAGVFATRDIPRGSRVMVEEPQFTIDPPWHQHGREFLFGDMLALINAGFNGLRPTEQDEFLACHEHHENDEPGWARNLYIFRSNAYHTARGSSGMFVNMARINHSCRPNVVSIWNETGPGGVGRMVVWAARNIRAGEELLVSYIPLLGDTQGRQARLKQYGFVCDCDACRDGAEGGDDRRVQAGELLEDLENFALDEDAGEYWEYERRLRHADELTRLLEREGLADYFARAYHLAARFSLRVNRTAEARHWALKESEVRRFGDGRSLSA